MLENIQIYFTLENIYTFANLGVIPFWLLLMFFPNETITKFIVHSVVAPLILSAAYIYIAINIFLESNIFEVFNLYYGLEDLYTVFSNESFLLIFWLHFLSISLFVGSWISRDCVRYNVPKFIMVFILTITYFTGPVGLIIYWVIRLFFAKKISFND